MSFPLIFHTLFIYLSIIWPLLDRHLSDTCSMIYRTSIEQVLYNYRTYSYAPPKVDLRYIGVRLELYWNDIGVLSEIDKTVVGTVL